MLQILNIFSHFDSLPVLKDISFRVKSREKVAIAGESGSGKTSLLKIIAGLMQPSAGQVLFRTEKIPGPDEKLIAGHDKIAYVSQHFELRNNYRVQEELDYNNNLQQAQASFIYEVCRINHLLQRWTNELSGGERQRIVTARALISKPEVLLLDEPFSNLDLFHRQLMKEVISDITEKTGITCILVSHDPLDILSWAEKIIVLKDGTLVQEGTSKEIYLQPINEYTAGLFGKYNLLTPTLRRLFPATTSHAKSIILRPEFFHLSVTPVPLAVKGTVKRSFYFGSFLEVEMLLSGIIIIGRIKVGSISEGDTVYVSVAG